MAIALLRQTPERNLENPPKRKRDGGGTNVPPFLYQSTGRSISYPRK
ncbi:hypothetical protein LEP1GSC050_2446 [Leptospira broomii serovar Hurstbridge str. 5399]|uniref:Uncharacterized protein n=1 Tax=Leptospira broomii serovar Hurstbridge str. 5399 TaxID=1049789 RepID=T0FAR8_9LEPT|nr:hypothetical protein LEP1GSC050_2446 [Leptospira broomii serovar Hurstbridge str. 5399]